jgi:hypothetical protein
VDVNATSSMGLAIELGQEGAPRPSAKGLGKNLSWDGRDRGLV